VSQYPAFRIQHFPKEGMMRVKLIVFAGLVLAVMVLIAWAANGNNTPTPANPKQFHDQEAARIERGIEAQAQLPLLSEETDYDVTYYNLDVDARNYSAQQMSGKVDIFARSVASDLNEIVLDFCATMTLDSVYAMGVPTTYTRNGAVLRVALNQVYGIGQAVNVRIVWHGTPCNTNENPSYSFYDRPVGSHTVPSVSTLSEPFGARDWWPCKDVVGDKADSARISITVADTVTAVSNGLLESTTVVPPSSRRFTWFESYPIDIYLICFAATNYAHFREWYIALNSDSMPIDLYPYPEYLSNAQVSWSNCPSMVTFLANTFGEYPFLREKYGMTNFQWAGGMEHQTNTFYGYQITTGDHTYDWIEVHELSHQWWGDRTTCATWPDVWLNEGMASYMEALWFEHLNGPQALRNYETNLNNNGVTDPSGPVYNPSVLFDGNTVYNKGSWILHMLRGVIHNDSLFFAAMRYYGAQHNYGVATTAQFLSDISTVVGYDVTPFLYTYLYRTNRPRYRVTMGRGIVDGQQHTVIRIRQTQTNPDTTFHTMLDLRFANAGDTARRRVEEYDWQQRYHFDLGFRPLAATFVLDPDDWVLKNMQAMDSTSLLILNANVDTAVVGVAYTDTLLASGSGTRSWSILPGAMPQDLTLSTDGILSGTPDSSGDYPFRVRVQNSTGGADTVWFTLTVLPPPEPPTRVTVYCQPDGRVRLLWTAAAQADSYYVYRATHVDMSDAQHILTTASTIAYDSTAHISSPDSSQVRFYQITTVRHLPQ
jgi:aminopeptidase N